MSAADEASVRLRRAAEMRVADRGAAVAGAGAVAGASADAVIRELRIHQEELEIQNEELREARAEIESSRERYADLFDFAPVGIMTLTREALVAEANLAAASLLGMDRARLIGRPFRSHLAAHQLEAWDVAFSGLLRAPGRRALDLELARAGGVSIATVAECVRDADARGEVLIRVALIDVTERMRTALELSRLRDDLERRVRDRTLELETFMYAVAHDLQGPVRHVEGFSKILLATCGEQLDAEARRLLGRICEAAEREATLLNGLAAFARLGSQSMDGGPVRLERVVAGVIAQHAAEIEAGGATVTSAVPEILVHAHESALAPVISGLLDNALKFHRPGEAAKVHIGARSEAGRCTLFVRDQGIGFDMKFGDRLFVLFQRLVAAEQFEGTGLGLALVRRTVERMNGRVWAESSPGAGATFFVELPV